MVVKIYLVVQYLRCLFSIHILFPSLFAVVLAFEVGLHPSLSVSSQDPLDLVNSMPHSRGELGRSRGRIKEDKRKPGRPNSKLPVVQSGMGGMPYFLNWPLDE